MQIATYKPCLPPYELVEPDIREMYRSGMLYPGQFTERLVGQVKSYCGVRYVLPVNSCSTGLLVALSMVPAGQKVVMPAFTFNSTLQSLEWNGLVPLVVDVDDHGQLDLDKLADCLAENPHGVGAVLPVHMWGNLVDVSKVVDVIADRVPYVFFDGAHVFGSTRDAQVYPGDATIFSIAATKPVSAGEGGLLVTNDDKIYTDARDVAFHGLFNSLNTRIRGINGKIQEFNSILAYHAIANFDQTKARRRELMEYYRSELGRLPVRVWSTQSGVDPSYKDCVLFAEDADTRNRLDTFVQSKHIGTKRYFEPAIPDMGSFRGIVHSADNARRLAATCLALPLYPDLTDNEIEYVVQAVRAFYGG